MNASLRIMIVDDEAAIRTSLAAFLEDFGHDLMVTDSAEEALILFKDHDFDIAIVDLRLPAMTGDMLIASAHKLEKDVRFLIHTGSVDFSLTNELRALGMTESQIISKPQYDLNTFLSKIEELKKDEP